MLIEGCLMQSLTCVAADVANLNSFSLLPLGLAWMTSLHFSLESLSQSWRRSTFTSSTATLDATPASSSTWQIHFEGGKKGHQLCSKWLLGWQFRGHTVATFTLIPVLTKLVGIWEKLLQDVHQAEEPPLFSKRAASGKSFFSSWFYHVWDHAGTVARAM